MAKVKLGWGSLTVSEKVIKANSVTTSMSEHVIDFQNPEPPLATVKTAAQALSEAEGQAIKGGTDRIVVRNARLDELTAHMVNLVEYVQVASKGIPEIIARAGLEVYSERTPWPVPDQVNNLRPTPGQNVGSVNLIWDAARYKKLYRVEMWVESGHGPVPPTPEPGPGENGVGKDLGQWITLTDQGGRTYRVEGLETGKVYKFRVAAINSTGIGAYSLEVSCVAR